METKQVIYNMLTENTGKHFLDSGWDPGEKNENIRCNRSKRRLHKCFYY